MITNVLVKTSTNIITMNLANAITTIHTNVTTTAVVKKKVFNMHQANMTMH